MKKFFLTAILFLFVCLAQAQAPKAINYQAVARNSSGQALANQTMKVRISLSEVSGTGASTYYAETRTVTTNALGLFNVQIGSAGALSTTGSFSSTDWLNNTVTHNMNVELDINNNNTFVSMGSQQLVSVPYALAADVAASSKSLQGNPVSSNTPANGDILKWVGNEWLPSANTTAPAIQTYNFFGSVGGVPAGGSNATWAFIGTTNNITLTVGQTLSGAFTAALGTTSTGGTGYVSLCICLQKDGTGPITAIYPNSYADFSVGTRISASASGTVKIGTVAQAGVILPGTYKVGLGIRNGSTVAMNNTDFMNGYVMVY